MAIVPCQSFADSSHRGIVEGHAQCSQTPMHLVESAAPYDSSRNSEADINKQHTLISV